MSRQDTLTKSRDKKYRFALRMVIFAAIGVLLVSALYIYYLFLNPSIKSKEDRDIIYYTAVLKKNPEDPDAYVNLAAAYAQKQEYDRSQKLLTEGMKKFPKDFRFPIEIAKNYYKIGSLSQSEKYAKKALDIRNDLSIAYYLLGKIKYRQRRIDEAQTYFSRAIKYDPYNADYYYELGKIYEEKGYRKQAIDLYKKALEYGPDLQKVRDSLERLNENAER